MISETITEEVRSSKSYCWLNITVSEVTKEFIRAQAQLTGVTISEVTRDMLELGIRAKYEQLQRGNFSQ